MCCKKAHLFLKILDCKPSSYFIFGKNTRRRATIMTIKDLEKQIPVYFLERKWKWAREHQLKCYVLVCLALAVVILLIGALFV